ncbi:MAG: hypothetical protein Ct9H300mP26_2100 [Acidimicrobiales bacterium]|nr:MAG: hypothetical protein Ct9H300mP26_2100 [Acidimicrobiales bacterium]
MVEYFFAHTVAPAFVALLVPSTVLITLIVLGWQMAIALVPFLAVVVVSPFLLRKRLDTLGSEDRETLGDLNAFVVDTVQGLGEVVAFQQGDRRSEAFLHRVQRHIDARLPFYSDFSRQTALLEIATGLGGLAVVVTEQGWYLEATSLPPPSPLTLLALACFLPVSGKRSRRPATADTLGASRRLHHVHNEPVTVQSASSPALIDLATAKNAVTFNNVAFSYPGTEKRALAGVPSK